MQDVITRAKIAALPDHAELRVIAGAIITRAARELIKEKGITLQFDEDADPESQDKDEHAEHAIVTVVGCDRVGIIARVAEILAGSNVNILDISQTVLQGFFAMIMILDLSCSQDDFAELRQKLEEAGEEMGLKITLQHEDVFQYMHRV
ncbi:MAG TPA: ACT domain-containing protein [Syntrophomonadaceae bacterium]|nr:ACT domain-containing protein [Syntrophomonadaceae bacterium]